MMLADRLTAALLAGANSDLRAGDIDLADNGAAATPAAVLIAIVDRHAPGLLLTRRTDHLRLHAGQVAFPGGRIDPDDADATAAALREAEEEIALPPAAVRVVGLLPPYRTITGYAVTPVVGIVPPGLPLMPREEEVAELFEAPLDHVLDPARHIPRMLVRDGVERHYIEIVWGDHVIWGATAAMIANLGVRLGRG